MSVQPSLFLSHGSPMVYVDEASPAHHFMKRLGRDLERPKGIVVVSAHWYTRQLSVLSNTTGQIIHDFYGFPSVLYDQAYPALGANWLVERLVACSDAVVDEDRGLDHGAWVPLGLMYPQADIPVVQLSIPVGHSNEDLYALGERLAPLREEGIMILASGSVTHNLSALGPQDAPAESWAQKAHDWFIEAVEQNDHQALLSAASQMPHFQMAHPKDDHWRPLYVALGAAQGQGEILHSGLEHGTLSMATARFD